MLVKLAVFACALALASAAYNGPLAGGQPAALYPAGVDPKACPNFPDCTNPSVAVNQIPQDQFRPQYAPQQYNAPQQYQQQQQYPQQYQAPVNQYNPVQQQQQYAPQRAAQYPPQVQNALDRGEYIGDGDYHGEGLAEALAPGYQAPQQQAQYNQGPAQYNPGQYNAQPAQYNPGPAQYNPQPAQIPAGLDAQACPNYPFCH